MKTTKLTAILIMAFLTAVSLPAVAMADVIGKITAFEGNVDILRQGRERAAPVVRLEEPVSEGDIVRTKSNAKAEITFTDNSVIRLAPGSRLEITEYLMDGNKRKSGVMNLFRGKVRAVVSKSRGFLGVSFGGGDRFEVRTPTAVAGVKGTDFFVSYSMGVTAIMVTDGSVNVFNPAIPGQIVLVAAGNATFIVENKPPSLPRPANDVEVIRHTRDTDTSEKPKENKGGETQAGGTTLTGSANTGGGDVFGSKAPEEGTALTTTTGGTDTGGTDTSGTGVTLSITEANPDLLPPIITFATSPPSITNSSTAAFTITFNEPVSATYTMENWGATTTNTTSDTFSIASLPEGSYTLTITATDTVGNITTQTYTWTTDYTAAALAFTSTPSSATDSPDANFGVSSSETVTYSYTLDGNAVTTASLTGLSEGSHIFTATATDAAGNTSIITYTWFYGAQATTLTGSASGTGSVLTGTVTGTLAVASTSNSGAWENTISGSYSGTPSSSWQLVSGGSGSDGSGAGNGYWLDKANGDYSGSTMSGTSSFTYLSTTTLGTGTGAVSGSYDIAGTWSATDSGAYTESPLAFSITVSDPNSNFASLLNQGLVWDGSIDGLMGGTSFLWNGLSSFIAIGTYDNPSGKQLWSSHLSGTTADGGTLQGGMSGIVLNDVVEGISNGFYIRPDNTGGYTAGYFYSNDISGNYYPDIDMWYSSGAITTVDMGTTSVDPSQLYPGSQYLDYTSYSGKTTGDIRGFSKVTAVSISDQGWGIWTGEMGGRYSTTPAVDWTSYMKLDSSNRYWIGNITGTDWSNGKLTGNILGAGADISATPYTWITVGETIGTFDAAAYTWQALQTGAWVETSKFLSMTQTSEGQASLTALNIPFAEVGRATLSGSGNKFTNITMTDTIFFAYQTGAAPTIWATGNVSGTYSATPVVNTPVILSGSGLSANFAVQQWNTTSGNWMATVTNGNIPANTMNNTSSLTFEGAAAGTGATAGSGSINGTAAGVVK